jgi:hypothetical protein
MIAPTLTLSSIRRKSFDRPTDLLTFRLGVVIVVDGVVVAVR